MATLLSMVTEPEPYSVVDQMFMKNWISEHSMLSATDNLDMLGVDVHCCSSDYDSVDELLCFSRLPDAMPYCSFHYASHVELWDSSVSAYRMSIRITVGSCDIVIAYVPVDTARSLQVRLVGTFLYTLYLALNNALIAMRAGSAAHDVDLVHTAALEFGNCFGVGHDPTGAYGLYTPSVVRLEAGFKRMCLTKTEFEMQRRVAIRNVLHLTDPIVRDLQREKGCARG